MFVFDLLPGVFTLAPVLAQSAPKPEELAQAIELLNFGRILQAVSVVAIAWVANRFLISMLDRMGEGAAKRRLLFKKIASFTRLAIFAFAAYLVIITFLEGNEDALLGLGATVALALGFALKDSASSLMAGILILIDQPFQVGDRVAFGDTYGEVTEIGLRSVRIVTLDDNEVSIPNNKFLTESVASANAGALDMMVVIKFHIAVTEDFELARRIAYEAALTSRYVFLKKPVSMAIRDEVTGAGLATVVQVKAYIIDARYETAFVTDVTIRVKREFREHRIQYPYMREYSVGRDMVEYFGSTHPEQQFPSLNGDKGRAKPKIQSSES